MKIRHIRKLDAKRAEASLYDELGRALTIFRVFSSQEEKNCWPLVSKIKFEKFDDHFNQRREVFYEIPENVGIRSLHGQFELNLQHGRERKYSAKHIVIELKRAIEYSIKVGEVNGGRIEAVALAYDEESKKKGPILYEHIFE